MDQAPKCLVRDRDAIYGKQFLRQAQLLGIKEILTAHRSPCQNPYFVGQYVDNYNEVRSHLSLYKDAPYQRPIPSTDQTRIVELNKVGELHHQYMQTAA